MAREGVDWETVEAVGVLIKFRNLVSECATSLLPGSYKLWHDYPRFRFLVCMTPLVPPPTTDPPTQTETRQRATA